ncbi:MAG: hypothetical protein ACJAYU_002826 [Bradymonadia bacterium]|jgi:hypothetical protein
MKRRLVAVSALFLCACAAEEQPPEQVRSTEQSLALESVLDGPSEALPLHGSEGLTPQVEDFGKRAHLEVVAPVDWQAASLHAGVPLSTIGSEFQSAVAESAVPVLIPSNATFVASTSVYTGEDWVSTHHRGQGVSIEVFGTRRAFSHPEVEVHELERIAEGRPLITRSEGVPFISFKRFGVSYQVSIECESGPADSKCTEFDYLRQVYDSLVVVGGAQ